MTSLRVIAAILAVFFGTATALAQGGDPKLQSPSAAKKPEDAKDKGKAVRKRDAAQKQPAEAAEKKPDDAKPKVARNKGKPKPEAAAKVEPANKKSKSADTKSANKKSADDKSANSSVSTASPEVKAALREAYAAIAPTERAAIQSDLIWTGDYNGLIDGQFSERLVDAVMAYQKRQKAKPTGVLSAPERTVLSAAIRPKRDEVGWQVVDDPVIGARVGLPGKLATQSKPGASGTRWSSEQSQLQIETFRIDTGASLDAVFEQQKKLPRRRITYNVLRSDYFVVSGMQGLKKMYVRAFAKDGEVRGVTILYDQAMEGTMDPIVVAMSSAFVPFAGYAAASAGNSSESVPRRKVEYGTGVVVSPSGHIVTAQPMVDGCQVIAIPRHGHAERLAEDKDSGLALLRVHGAQGLTPIQLQDGARDGNAATLVGIADPQAQAGGDAVTTAPTRLSGDALDIAPAAGFSGAAALDGQGRFLGIAMQRASIVAGVAGASSATLVPIARIRALLDANYVPPAAGRTGLDGAKAATVRVICVRK
jgi:peptidoglycan hydrolase-like protein with peptidoglycan-binding domain